MMKDHPRPSVNHLLCVDMRIRMNRRRKACSASENDLETSQVDSKVTTKLRFSPHSCTDVANLLDAA